MPLRCLNTNGESIQAFDLSDEAWRALAIGNRKSRNLRMPCCSAAVTLKQSKLGTKFFAHLKRDNCSSAPEREEHLHLKQLSVEVARKCGWSAFTEVTGNSPTGEEWRADVLATKGNSKVAIEIQWSRQTDEETYRRQKRYAESGIRCLWLFRQPRFPVNRDLPAICVGGDLKKGFSALVPWYSNMTLNDRENEENWSQVLRIEKLLKAAFRGYFQFGLPRNSRVLVTGRLHKVWCPSCRMKTHVIFPIELTFDATDKKKFANLNFFCKQPRLAALILGHVPPKLELCFNRDEWTEADPIDRLVHRCFFCQSEVFDNGPFLLGWPQEQLDKIGKNKKLFEFETVADDAWQDLLDVHFGRHWRVLEANSHLEHLP